MNRFKEVESIGSVCIKRYILASVIALLLTLAPALTFANSAFADVRKADVIMGSTIESRSLSAADCPDVDAKYAVLIDPTGTVVFERDAYESSHIASVTKVMTAIVALDYADMGTEVVTSEKAAEVGESSAGLQAGDVMTLETALYALMVPSGNDAAIAIAETVGNKLSGKTGDDAIAAFVNEMNNKAQALGCKNSVFTNPHGLDDGEWASNDMHSCAYDVAIMSAYAMQNDLFAKIVGGGDATINVKRDGKNESIELETTDELLEMYDKACGIKTGFTDIAGYCFSGAARINNELYYAVVLGSGYPDTRFQSTENLFEWVEEHRINFKLCNSKETCQMTTKGQTTTVPVVANVAHAGWVDVTFKATISDPNASVNVYDVNGNISQELTYKEITGDVHAGDVVGTATYKQRNTVVAVYDLVACEDQYGPNLFEGIAVWFDRLVRNFTGQTTVAESTAVNQPSMINDKTSLKS